jgi:DnaJ-class molecular chaperone
MSDDDDIDYYAVLELTSTATPAEIKKVLKNIVDLNKSDSDNTSNVILL